LAAAAVPAPPCGPHPLRAPRRLPPPRPHQTAAPRARQPVSAHLERGPSQQALHCLCKNAADVCTCGCCSSNDLSSWRPAHLSTLPLTSFPSQRRCTASREPYSDTLRSRGTCTGKLQHTACTTATVAHTDEDLICQSPLLQSAPDATEAEVARAGSPRTETCAREAARASPLLAPQGLRRTPHPSCAS